MVLAFFHFMFGLVKMSVIRRLRSSLFSTNTPATAFGNVVVSFLSTCFSCTSFSLEELHAYLLSSCLVGNDVVESPTRSRWYTALGAMWCVFAFRFYFPVTTVKSFKPVVFNADVHDLITYHGRPHLVGIMVRIDPIEVLVSFVLVLEITLLRHHLDASLMGVPNRPQVLGPDTRRHCTVAQICLNASIVVEWSFFTPRLV